MNTKEYSPSVTSAEFGSRTATFCSSASNLTRAYISGRSLPAELSTVQRTWMRRVVGSTAGAIRSTRPLNDSPAHASTSTETGWPTATLDRYCSGRSTSTCTRLMSVMTNSGSGRSGRASMPGLALRSATTPASGATSDMRWPASGELRGLRFARRSAARCASAFDCARSASDASRSFRGSTSPAKSSFARRSDSSLRFWSAFAFARSACAAPRSGASITASTAPAATRSPTCARSSSMRPAIGALILEV